MNEANYLQSPDALDAELSLDLKKLFLTIWNRKKIITIVFLCIFCFFVLSTFICTKKYKVDADLYINKTNNSNMAEINPFFIDEASGLSLNSIADQIMLNEMELMQSPLVIDKVIRENDLRYKKLFGFITTKKTGKYITTEKFLKKKFKIENKKGTSVVSISYKDKDRELAYNVINSIIKNYMILHKELNTEKSKSDKKIIEAEYNKAKANLDKKMQTASGLPTTSLSGTGNLAAMSAFSKSARQAIANLQNQYVQGEKSQLSVTEDAQKVSYLSSKLEWASLVEEMSNSSKVLVIKEPRMLEEYEQVSPKLFVNILLGIILGIIGSLAAVITSEFTNKKLSYSQLGDNIIYNIENEHNTLAADMLSNINSKKAFVFFEEVSVQTIEKLKQFKDTIFIKADISNDFTETINSVDSIVTFASINKTDKDKYLLIKKMITNMNKKIIYEVLI